MKKVTFFLITLTIGMGVVFAKIAKNKSAKIEIVKNTSSVIRFHKNDVASWD